MYIRFSLLIRSPCSLLSLLTALTAHAALLPRCRSLSLSLDYLYSSYFTMLHSIPPLSLSLISTILVLSLSLFLRTVLLSLSPLSLRLSLSVAVAHS